MISTRRATVLFLAGISLGGVGGYSIGTLLANLRGPSYELTDDIVLRHGGGDNPPLGHLRAGQRFDITMRKADVNYIRVYVATYDRDLAGHTRDPETKAKTTKAPWDQ